VVLYAEATDTKVYAAEAHLGVFAAYWLWQAIERPGMRRLAPVLLFLWTAVNLAWMIAVNWYCMEEYALDGRPLTVFWLVAGLLATAGAIGGPAGAPDLLIGGTAVAYGVVVLAVTGAESDTAFAVSWASFVPGDRGDLAGRRPRRCPPPPGSRPPGCLAPRGPRPR
jgi:hypothetical protein